MDQRKLVQTSQVTYVFENAARETAVRFATLQQIFDPGTKRHLDQLGVAPGWRCLEIGAGGPSLPLWLAGRVGRLGRVVATDIDTRHLNGRLPSNVEVLQHDIVCDPLPDASFDLVHARLVLAHLPSRREVLRRLVDTVKAGGWIVIEDFDSVSITASPDLDPTERPLKIWAALRAIFAEEELDELYGRRAAGQMKECGLVEVGAEGSVFRWQGGSAGAEFLWASAQQLRQAILASGIISEQELEEELTLLRDSAFAHPSPVMWTTWGRRAQ